MKGKGELWNDEEEKTVTIASHGNPQEKNEEEIQNIEKEKILCYSHIMEHEPPGKFYHQF